MTNLSEELVNILKGWRAIVVGQDIWMTKDEVAYRQIVALIKKPKVTEEKVLDCVKKWLQIKAKEMEKRDEDPTKYNLYQLPADIDHSELLERLLKGEKATKEAVVQEIK